jgi:glycosyltransferase involved in cell wall biosynthesis
MNVDIYLMCYNEAQIIAHTIYHYRTMLPRCSITILDNMSTDDSVAIARQHRCKIRQFRSDNEMSESIMLSLRNECWKSSINKWVIMADMDEWLCVKDQDLIEEDKKGTTILTVKGYNMIGDSKDIFLQDINLHQLYHGVYETVLNKSLCFKVGPIRDMNFTEGCHSCYPSGSQIQYSQKEYILKHMDYLGLPYKLDKQYKRWERSKKDRQRGLNYHYQITPDSLQANHERLIQSRMDIRPLLEGYCV